MAKITCLKILFFKKNLNSELIVTANQLLNAHLGQIVAKINTVIDNQKQIILKKYHLANSNNISNRLIEPIKFTENYSLLCAYEIESKQNKFYAIERITDIEILKNNFEFSGAHCFEGIDAFGFAPDGNLPIAIELRLNLRAYVILKHDYPMVIPYIHKNSKSNFYLLEINVNNPKPITRFILGLHDEIEIIGSLAFINHLNTFIKKLLIKKL